jgi:hypothetical protein
MRVWDVNPGYLNRQSLLGEHTEIHALVSITENEKRGFAHHPETLRWKRHLGALKLRHDLVVGEMALRGYQHHSPVEGSSWGPWPDTFVDTPGAQFAILSRKYEQREPGRIPLPRTVQQLWAQHRYSILARDTALAQEVEQRLTEPEPVPTLEQLAAELVAVLRRRPPQGQLWQALLRMCGETGRPGLAPAGSALHPSTLLENIRQVAVRHQVVPLLEATALSDFAVLVTRPLQEWEGIG